MTSKSKKPLPLSDILRDLALLRASGHKIPEIYNAAQCVTPSSGSSSTVESSSIAASYNYITTVKAALKINDSKKLEIEEEKIEDVRNKYEQLNDAVKSLNW